ncbi:MAG: 5-(carboxyamino)imidazole ribonucleotide synthase [Nakamurella sp.]
MDSRTGLPRVGMVGGGQLARMTHQAAIPLGQSLRVLAQHADDSAALVAPDVQLGEHTDLDALRRFAVDCDVLTFDHEHVPGEHLRALQAAGVLVHPGPDALQFAQDKALMRQRLQQLGLPVPAFRVVQGDPTEAIGEFRAAHGDPVVVKAARGGYDGRGVWVVRAGESPQWPSSDIPWVLEEFVPLRRELALVLARSPFGQAAIWPVVHTVQEDGICVEVIAPAPGLSDQMSAAASRLAATVAEQLDVVGVLAVELFEVEPGDAFPDGLVVNELAMRPHNSGHWTMDGSVTSQFEQHLRAVLDYPLGSTASRAEVTVMGNVLGGPDDGPGAVIGIDERIHHLSARFPQVRIHWYGKGIRPGRKLGHVNVCGDRVAADGSDGIAELRRIARLSATWLGTGVWSDGYEIHGGTTVPAVESAEGEESE